MSAILLGQFDSLVNTPEAVDGLRRLVLDLAVRGLLVPQDPGEESADALLKLIGTEKIRRYETGEIRKPKSLSSIGEDEQPFDVPEGWAWARFGHVSEIASNLQNPAFALDLPHIAPNHIEKDTGRLLPFGTVREDGVTSNKHRFFPGQILYSKIRPNLNKAVVVDFEGLCSADMYPLEPYIDTAYFHRYILSAPFVEQVVSDDNRLAMPKVNQTQLQSVAVAVPPLPEQRRIVARLNELMALCDQLSDRLARRDARRQQWAASTVRHLSEDAPIGSNSAWAFAEKYFDELLATPEAVPQLRKLVLDLAVRGKLTQRDSDDGPVPIPLVPVESLLKEKTRNGLSARLQDEPIGSRVLRISAGTSRSDFAVDESDYKYAEVDQNTIDRLTLQPGDLLACRFNGNLHYVGRFSIYVGESEELRLFPDKLIRFRVDPSKALGRYVVYAMNSPDGRAKVEGLCATTAGNIGVSATKLRKLEIPVPPLAEQRRIVARVDELMALCDRLDAKLAEAERDAERLMRAVLEEALAPAQVAET